MSKWFIYLLFTLQIITIFAHNNYVVQTFPGPDGRLIDKITVPGISVSQRVPGPVATPTRSAMMLTGVPTFDWSYGCSATSASMISGYYDRRNFGHIYSGSTNGGVMPLNNNTWGAGECPLSATHQGYDGLATAGHVDRFWTNSTGSDPFGTGDPTGTYANCTADYMGTNQDWWGNSDGSTTFYNYVDGSALHDPADGTTGPPYGKDGIHGFRLFLESRGYSVSVNYNQYINGWNGNTIGYTLANYKASIDAGIPVLIQLEGHTMVGVGYESTNSTIYVHNTWDYQVHSMTWGGVYSGMTHYGVGVIQLNPPPSITVSSNALTANLPVNGTGTDSFTITNNGTGLLTYNLGLASTRSLTEDTPNALTSSNANRSIAGSTLNVSAAEYSPGTTQNWTFTVTNGGTDEEWLKHVIITFPTGVTVNSSTNFIEGGGGDMVPTPTGGNGVIIDWLGESGGWGVVYCGRSATATVNVSIASSFTGTITLPYQIQGDVYGADPHIITGDITIAQAAPLLPWFNAVPLYGSIPAGQNQTITGYFSAAGLTNGTYTASLKINSNDPYTPILLKNVTLNVSSGTLAKPVINSISSSHAGITLNWNSVSGALHYKVYRSFSPQSGFTLLQTVDSTTFTDSSTSAEAFYQVIAVN